MSVVDRLNAWSRHIKAPAVPPSNVFSSVACVSHVDLSVLCKFCSEGCGGVAS